MRKKSILSLLLLLAFMFACVPSFAAPTQDVDLIVQSTLQALTLQALQSTPEAQSTPVVSDQTGSISGKLSYPSSGIPPLLVVAFNLNNVDYYWIQTAQDQSTYQMDGLPVGTYHVVAYVLPDGKLAGRYDQFYVCGLAQGCNDENWVDVQVQAGVVTPNVDPGNWYGGPELYPPMPSYEAGQPSGSGIYSAPMPALGSITGKLSYPSSFIPSMTVVALNAKTADYYYVITNENAGTYQIDNLPPGSYYVVAYPGNDSSYPGGYSQAVPCGLDASCSDHSLIPVDVNGQLVTGIDPGDFYAPPGTFPASPVP
ncbi:MAG: carboxypeptidase-like regulatory domain-containing protein [Anaerolineales bacterium]